MEDIPEFNPEWLPVPQPDEVSKQEKEDAFGSYIMMFAGTYFPFPLIEILMAAIYYNYHKRKSRFVAFHSWQSLLLQIPVSLVSLGVVVWGLVLGVFSILGK